MAEKGAATLPELAGFDEHLEGLSVKYSQRGLRIDSQSFCSEFCQLVEEFCGVQSSPAPQLHVLEVALCYFFTASSFLPPHCDHVHYTLSSLALSVFELLLFFDQKEFSQDTLQHLTYTFQECHSVLAKHPNVYLLQLKSLIQDGGPWGNRVLQAILSDSDVPQSKVDRFISSEAPLFLELRVRYLLSSGRSREAAALARHCAARLSSRQRPFFLQVRLAWLCKTEQTEQLHREVCALGGAEVLQVICGMERQEEGAVLLCLCRTALRRLLHTGHMHCLWQLVCVWGVLHRRQQTSSLELLEESRSLLQSATHITAIFPFIRVLPEALGNMGLQFCVELCSQALQSGLVSDSSTKSLVYKTVASLLPRDLEVCRACALLVFCQERTVEAYRTVVHLYSLPDQEYHAETRPIGNHVRFDLLQVLKKGLVFDPEFWNITAIRSHCLKLLNGKALKAAREEVPEEESHCTKEAAVCPNIHQPSPPTATDPQRSESKKCQKNGMAPKRTRLCRGNEQTAADSTQKKKIKHTQRTPSLRESGDFLRRSFWQPSKTNDRFSLSPSHGEQQRITRFSETNRPKRRIRTPRWLLEDSGKLEENAHRKVKKLRKKQQQEEEEVQEKARPLVKRNISTLPKTSSKEKPLMKCDLAENQSVTRHLKGLSLDYLRPTSPAQVILEFSLPDNELSDIFTDESFSRRKGLTPVLLYKTSVKEPHSSRSDKTVHLKRVIISAPDEVSLAQQLHCYARRNKHLTVASRVRSTPSVVTRSSAQAPPTKGRHGRSCSKPLVEMKVTIASQTPVRSRGSQSPLFDKSHGGRAKTTSEGSLPSDNKTNLVAHRSLTPGKMDIKTDQKPTTNAVANTLLVAGGRSSKDSVGQDVGHSNACKDLATLQIGGVSDSTTAYAPAKDSNANLNIAGRDDAGRHCVDDQESIGHDVVTGHFSDRHGSHVEEDLHGLMLLSETVSALAPAASQFCTGAPGEVMEKQNLPVSQSPTRGTILNSSPPKTVAPSSPPRTEKSASSLSKPDTEEEMDQETEDSGDQISVPPESEESHLEYCCTLCNKVFRGKRVVVHAMFHYRRDRCMFCGVLFKDDLLAMMHLSEHIDKLKKLKEMDHKGLASNVPQRSTEPQTISPPCATRGRPRKSRTTPPPDIPDTTPSESRRLRSDSNLSKGSTTPLPQTKVNGHIKRSPTLNGTTDTTDNSPLVLDHNGPQLPVEKDQHAKINGPSEHPRLTKPTAKHQEADSAVETCCPVVGCHWHGNLSRSPLTLLYHALEDHHRDDTPLELAFHMGNGQCSVCLRVLWSFQHYRHHVERHRLTPRHPCLHQGCGARFKTGMEMRRHSRKHIPLQASCCLPGCSERFICLWALNLHEREHYAVKNDKSAKACGEENRGHSKTEQTRLVSGSAHAVTIPMRGKGNLEVTEQTLDVPSTGDAQAGPRTEVTAVRELGKERSALRSSKDSKQVENVHVPNICPADSHSRVSRKLRKTHLRQKTQQTQSSLPSSLINTNRRMRLRREKRKVKLKVITHKSKNLLLTELGKIASGKKSPRKQRCGRVVEEKLSSNQNFTVASTPQEQSLPTVASIAQDQSVHTVALMAQEQFAPMSSTAQERLSPTLLSTAQEQSVPTIASSAQEQLSPTVVSTAQEKSVPTMASTTQERSVPTLASTTQEQSVPTLASTTQEKSAFMSSTAQEQSAPIMASTAQVQSSPTIASTAEEQSAPTVASTAQERLSPTLLSTAQEQSVPTIASSAQEQLSPTVVSTAQEKSVPTMASTTQERSVPTLASTIQEQSVPTLASTTQEKSAFMSSTAQEQSAPIMASTAQVQSSPTIASTAEEQSAPTVASTAQEQSAPTVASTAQEQSASTVASTAQEQSASTVASTAQEQSSPTIAYPAPELSEPTVASTAQEQCVPIMASTAQENSSPAMASTAQENSFPTMASTAEEQSAPTVASTAQEQSAPTMASAAQEQSAPTVASTAQEQSAPTMASTAQEQSAPTVASTAQEQSAPTVASTAQEHSAPLMASTAQQQLSPTMASTSPKQNKLKVPKKHKHISAVPSDGNMDKKRKFSHAKSGPKTTQTSTGTTSTSKCKTPSNVKHLTVGKTSKGPSVGKTSKGPSVGKTTKGPSVGKTTKGPSVGKTTKGPSVTKTTKGPLVAKTTKIPSVANTTKSPSFVQVPQAATDSHIGEVKPSVTSNHAGYTVLVNGAAIVKQKAAVEAPGKAWPKEAGLHPYRKNYFRPPPTTYLDESFTNMPKRRKHMSMFSSMPPAISPPQPTTRCANCFVTFSHEIELQIHLRDKKCSSMFGFDSDEDNS